MTARTIRLILLLTSAVSIGCDSDGPTHWAPGVVAPPGPDPSVFTTLEVLPDTVTLDEGVSLRLQVVARDQRDEIMAVEGEETFFSSNPAIATVSNVGMVTGLAIGTADISVTKRVRGVIRSASMKATIREVTPLDSAVVTADRYGWQPPVVHLKVGGKVKWVTAGPLNWAGTPHRMIYLIHHGVEDSLDLSTGSATLEFLRPGKYDYCSGGCWDPPDFGIIYVH